LEETEAGLASVEPKHHRAARGKGEHSRCRDKTDARTLGPHPEKSLEVEGSGEAAGDSVMRGGKPNGGGRFLIEGFSCFIIINMYQMVENGIPTTCFVPFPIDSRSSASYANTFASIRCSVNATVNLGLPSKYTATPYWKLTTTARPTTFARCGRTYGRTGTHMISGSSGRDLHMSTPFHDHGRGVIMEEWHAHMRIVPTTPNYRVRTGLAISTPTHCEDCWPCSGSRFPIQHRGVFAGKSEIDCGVHRASDAGKSVCIRGGGSRVDGKGDRT